MSKAHLYLKRNSTSVAQGYLNNHSGHSGGEWSETAKDRVLWEYSSRWEIEKRNLAMRADNIAGGYR